MARYSIADAAKLLGVSRDTLRRWEKQQKVAPVRRDRNGDRIYTDEDIQRIQQWADAPTEPEPCATISRSPGSSGDIDAGFRRAHTMHATKTEKQGR